MSTGAHINEFPEKLCTRQESESPLKPAVLR